MARELLTFYREPVTLALYDPARPGGFLFRMDAGGGEFYQLYWYDLAAGRATLLTDGKSRSQGLTVAGNGGRFAFTATLRNGVDFDLYVGRSDGSKPRLVKQLAGDWIPLDWSPDDKKILVRREISANESELEIV